MLIQQYAPIPGSNLVSGFWRVCSATFFDCPEDSLSPGEVEAFKEAVYRIVYGADIHATVAKLYKDTGRTPSPAYEDKIGWVKVDNYNNKQE